MKRFGLIGFPLAHSFSKKYFEEKFAREGIKDFRYDLFPLRSESELISLVKSTPDLAGLNVTIPYKESVMEYMTSTDAVAEEIGAVNCIKIANGKLSGYNTDAYGFEVSLKKFLSAGTGSKSKSPLGDLGVVLWLKNQ